MALIEKLRQKSREFEREVWESHASNLDAIDMAELLAAAANHIEGLSLQLDASRDAKRYLRPMAQQQMR